MTLRKFLAALAAAMVLLLLVLIWSSPANGDFRADNHLWNGTRNISAVKSARILESLSGLPTSPGGSTLILIPYTDFAPAELAALNAFVSGGGTLVLADDYGYGNRVLEYLGLKVKFAQVSLVDPLANYKNKWLPQITAFNPDPLTDNVTELVLNHATTLLNVDKANALALSSHFSFLDRNDNGLLNGAEPTGPFPVMSRHGLGSGQVVIISDPSLFINSMEAMEGNHRFVQNLTASSSALYVDQSHLPPSQLGNAKELLTRVRGVLLTPPGTLGMLLLALAIILKPIWHPERRPIRGDK